MRIDRVKLIAEMARKNTTCNELAEKALVSRVTVSAMRCGKSVTENSARSVARALGVELAELLENSDKQKED